MPHPLLRPVAHVASPTALPGRWLLRAGEAITVHARAAGVLHITQGRVWITLDGPHPQPGADNDLFLQAGARLPLRAGQRAVVEPLAAPDGPAQARLHWEHLPA